MIDVIVLNWNRPDHLQDHTLPVLLGCDCVGKIIVSHGKPETFFPSPHPRVECHKHFELNDRYGLSLRFYCFKYVDTDSVLILDDDKLVDRDHVLQLAGAYEERPGHIHGYDRRYIFHTSKGLAYGNMGHVHRYLFDRAFLGQVLSGGLDVSIILTSFMMAPKTALETFWNERSLVEDFVREHSTPLWNGEDIVLNLLHISRTGRFPVAHRPRPKLKDIKSQGGVSSHPSHLAYRTALVRHVCQTLSLDL